MEEQKITQQKPLFLNMDTAYEELKPDEAPFIKNMGWDINGNPDSGIGTNNSSESGQNMFVLTPVMSNEMVAVDQLPDGYNKCHGRFESITTQELYYFNYNDRGNHGIYVIDGNTGLWSQVIVDPVLNFSENQESFISQHRVTLRVKYDSDKQIIEKYLIFTDGNNWPRWISVIASTKTNGFDSIKYPYWTLKQPHFDKRELIEYATRPPMIKPIVSEIANTDEDKYKVNLVIDKAFQFAYSAEYTDGRTTALSPYSLPFIVNSSDFISNPDFLPKKANIKLYAGSPLWEKVILYVREATVIDGTGSVIAPEWGDWHKYDVINKFTDCNENSPSIIGIDYWNRTNPYQGLNYDNVFNTIDYVFDNSKVGQVVDQNLSNRLYNDIPIKSVAQSDLGDAIMFSNVQYGYDNLPCEITNNISIEAIQDTTDQCVLPYRNIKLYAYIGRERALGGDEDTPRFGDVWTSQIGYYNGEGDKTVRWGGMFLESDNVYFDLNESQTFDLTFGGRDSLIVYLKGTQYSAVGEWYVCEDDGNFTLTKVDHIIDITNSSDRDFVRDALRGNKFFVCMFSLNVPAGRYIAALGRHNVPSDSDYRNKSTYVYGIGNSRSASLVNYLGGGCSTLVSLRTVSAPTVVTRDKEIEIDCTNSNIDTWGNGSDLFYVVAPFIGSGKPGCSGAKRNRWTFAEGYLKESKTNNIGVERFFYSLTDDPIGFTGDYTDKNGFFWGYTWGGDSRHNHQNIGFSNKVDCIYPYGISVNSIDGGGYRNINDIYFDNYNGGVVGYANYVKVNVKISDTTGSIGYSNIGISIKNGMTAYTNTDGIASLIVHNGSIFNRIDNIYINAGGDFIITQEDCGEIPLYNYNDSLVPCSTIQERVYPLSIDLKIVVQGGSLKTIKSNASYAPGFIVADLAGRVSFVNPLTEIKVSSFLERDNTLPTRLRASISTLNINAYEPELKWASFAVSKGIGFKRYVQWIGDKIEYIDGSGNVTESVNNAVFAKITIQSLFDFNVKNNFSVLSKYQFAKGDRVRILDDSIKLLSTDIYGSPIDLQVWGTNYNQAAINAGLLTPETNVVLDPNQNLDSEGIGVIVKYDARLDKLLGKQGFWIELYTPTQISDVIPYYESAGYYPVIDGVLQKFTGFDINGSPVYEVLSDIDIDYWDTYLFTRNIAIKNTGTLTFNHAFESPNVTDTFGANLASGGRVNTKNDEAAKRWFRQDTIKSDEFIKDGIINGLGTFRAENKKSFSDYKWGGIVAVHPERNLIAFICENDFFTTDYNFHYAYPDARGVMVTNLNGGLGEAHQKIGSNYGCSYEHTATILHDDRAMYWFDSKNTAFIKMTYSEAIDISQKNGDQRGGIQSYMNAKSKFINAWNNSHGEKLKFDVVAGIDIELGRVYITFRPRRGNSNDSGSYINDRREPDVKCQETLIYDIQYNGWTGFVGFAPEAYGKLRGKDANVEMYSFAAGVPYKHNNVNPGSYGVFYGQQTTPVITLSVNTSESVEKSMVKVFQTLSHDSIGRGWYVDMAYGNERNSFSYIPSSLVVTKEHNSYAAFLRDMVSYQDPNDGAPFASMLLDGKRLFGTYLIVRMIGDLAALNKYCQLKNFFFTYVISPSSVKK